MFCSSLKHGRTIKHVIGHSLCLATIEALAKTEKSFKESSVSDLELQHYLLVF
jgi:hypothetical protein